MFFSRKFFPFFATFFLGAFNDNIFRNALVILITYQSGYSEKTSFTLSFLAMCLLMLPYFPFSATAGQLADKYSRTALFRFTKMMELVLMIPVFFLFRMGNVPLLLCLLFFMGTQSTLFSPLKYSYIPQVLSPSELLIGNAYVNAGTYFAIILGAVLGNCLITLPHGGTITGGIILIVAVLGCTAAFLIPKLPGLKPDLKLDRSCSVATWHILKIVFRDRIVAHCVMGLSMFWMTAALYVSLLAGGCKEMLHAQSSLVPVFYLLFSAGVAVGSLLCKRIGARTNIMKLVSPALLLMGLFTVDFYFAVTSGVFRSGSSESLFTLREIAVIPAFWRACIDLLGLSACGGFYSVPLNALMQGRADRHEVARIVAGNNIVNSAAIALGTLLVMLLTSTGIMASSGVILLLAGFNFLTALYMLILRGQVISGDTSKKCS